MKIFEINSTVPLKFGQFKEQGDNIYMPIYQSVEAMQTLFSNMLNTPDEYDLSVKNNSLFNSEFTYSTVSSWKENFINAGISDRSKWLTINDLKEGKSVKTFHSFDEVKRVEEIIKNKIKLPVLSIEKTKQLEANSLGRGVFSFDRAAQGMYRVYEFYSLKLEKIVDETEVEKIAENTFVLKADGSEVERRAAVLENGKPKVRTNSKKVWLNFEEKEKPKKSVSIYVMSALSVSENSTHIVYTGAYLTLLADFLNKNGYELTILSCEGGLYSENNIRKSFINSVFVKKPLESLDSNSLLIATSDVRFFRTAFFRAIYTGYKIAGLQQLSGNRLGYPIKEFTKEMQENIINYFDAEKKGLHFFIDTITSLEKVIVVHNKVMKQVEAYEQATA